MALNQEVSAINQQATGGKILPQKAQQQIEQRKQHWEHQIKILQQTSTIMQVQQKKVEQIQMQMMQEMAAIELQVTSGAIPAEQAQQQIIQSRQLHERQIQTLQQQMLIKQQQNPEMQMMGGVGITLEPASAGSNGCCVVKEIKMGGSVQMSGKVQLGDRLLRVNKVSCVGLSREQIKEYVVGPVGTRVEMVFDRDSQVITVELLRQLPQAAEAGWREVERVVRVATPHQQQHQPSSVVQQNPPLHPDYDLEAAIAVSRCTLLFS
jgi:C-terminal processing protease CtpA/Prc